MNNFQLSEEQVMVQDTVRRFVQDVAEPQALEHDEHSKFVGDGFAQLAETGMIGVAVAEDSGGAGLGMLAYAVALEEIGKGCGSTGRLFLTQAGQCGKALEGVEAAGELLGEVLMGESIAAFVGIECGVRASGDGDSVTLDGAADYVTAATAATTLVVCARTAGGAAVLARVAADAARIERLHALGYRAAGPGSVRFEGAAATVLARGADAEAAFERAGLAADIGAAALAVGSAQQCVELSRRHTAQRVAFGKPLLRQQAVGHKLSDSLARALGAKHLLYHAARLADEGADARDAARLARISAIGAALIASDEGVQVHGGYGFTVEYHVERHYRDAKTLEVLDGGTLAMRDALTAHLIGSA